MKELEEEIKSRNPFLSRAGFDKTKGGGHVVMEESVAIPF